MGYWLVDEGDNALGRLRLVRIERFHFRPTARISASAITQSWRFGACTRPFGRWPLSRAAVRSRQALVDLPVDVAADVGRQAAEGAVHAVPGGPARQANDEVETPLGRVSAFADDLAALALQGAAIDLAALDDAPVRQIFDPHAAGGAEVEHPDQQEGE